MDKTYVRINWENEPSMATPVGATNLNKIDYAVNEIDNRVITLDTGKASQTDELLDIKTVAYNSTTGVWTFTHQNGTVDTFDQNIEKIPVSFSMDANGVITMTTTDGTQYTCDVSTLIKTYTFSNTNTIQFTTTTDSSGNKTVTANVIDGSITRAKLDPDYLAQIDLDVASASSSANSASSSASTSTTQALKSEGFAVGQQNGTDVASDSPYYWNNAKYYSESADNSASSAATSAANAHMSEINASASATSASSGADASNISALKSEGFAIGSQNGVIVGSSSPYYENNSKYFSQQASTSASNASTSESNALSYKNDASASATSASGSATTASNKALDSEAYAVGTRNGTPVPSTDPAYENNAKYYAEHMPSSLAGLTDTNISSATDGQVLKYNGTTQKWENENGGGGASSLADLTDTNISSATNGQSLIYNSTSQKWENGNEKLSNLSDANISSASDKNILQFNSTSNKWENKALYKKLTATLTAGSTTLTFTDSSIVATSLVKLFSAEELDYESATSAVGSVTFTFEAQASDVTFTLLVMNL